MKLRRGVIRDIARMSELDRLCFPKGIAYSQWEFHHYLKLEEAEVAVMEEEGGVTAFIVAASVDDETWEIVTLDVHPGHRKQGLATQLLGWMEGVLAGRGVSSISLQVGVSNHAAVSLYAKNGYTISQTLSGYYREHGDAYLMAKLLKR